MMGILTIALSALTLTLTACGGQPKISDTSIAPSIAEDSSVYGVQSENADDDLTAFQMDNGKSVYVYGQQSVLRGEQKVPLILFMCGTTCDPQEQAKATGWADKARAEDIIVISPDYNNYATYSETEFLATVIDEATSRYPIDTNRIYSVGFSNGGAASVALASRYPKLLTGIAAYGWMVDMQPIPKEAAEQGIPFQVIQGTQEYTERDAAGNPTVMPDEQQAIRSLLIYNGMIDVTVNADYKKTPYWGYEPSKTSVATEGGRTWTISDYVKDGFAQPFAQLILIEGAGHICHKQSAEYSWEFLQQFERE